MSRAWPHCSPACRSAFRASPSIGSAPAVPMRWAGGAGDHGRPDRSAIAGGVESMTRAPFVMAKPDKRLRPGHADRGHGGRLALVNPQMQACTARPRCPRPAKTSPSATRSTREEQDRFRPAEPDTRARRRPTDISRQKLSRSPFRQEGRMSCSRRTSIRARDDTGDAGEAEPGGARRMAPLPPAMPPASMTALRQCSSPPKRRRSAMG